MLKNDVARFTAHFRTCLVAFQLILPQCTLQVKLPVFVARFIVPLASGADLGGGCSGSAPPPPWDDVRFSNTNGILQKKTMWFIAVEVEQETSAPPPKKKPGSAPEPYRGLTAVYKQAHLCSRIRVQTANNSGNGFQIWTKLISGYWYLDLAPLPLQDPLYTLFFFNYLFVGIYGWYMLFDFKLDPRKGDDN